MKVILFAASLLAVPADVSAANHAPISPHELVAAIKRADPVQLDGVEAGRITASSVRVVRCIGSDEEPTEFACVWQTRAKNGWVKHRSQLAVDGKGWHFID